ncbi:hypothetical protein [Pseudomonas brassicacearum]|uniref:hypothetical protein n=1 Tax=Pseudomonas brassicacearum TaxID=930166 RepID=UPI001E2F305D|nr:hypothetical protein [Pseudomonas brassicacearum]
MAINQSPNGTNLDERGLIHFTPFADKDMNGWILHENSTLETDYFCCMRAGSNPMQELHLPIADLPEFNIGASYLVSVRARLKGGSELDSLQITNNVRPVIKFSAMRSSWETYTGGFVLKTKDYLSIAGFFVSDDGELYVDDISICAIY